jgi:hypothetical protein
LELTEIGMMPEFFMVFDVESVGLHGEGFAVGWCVVNRDGLEVASGVADTAHEDARGTPAGRSWFTINVDVVDRGQADDLSIAQVRAEFWRVWTYWKEKGAALVADCGWPVEARFLAACVDDRPEAREWEGPYPMHELASVQMAVGIEPLLKRDRLPDELPEHDPLADARQSARLLIEALNATGAK